MVKFTPSFNNQSRKPKFLLKYVYQKPTFTKPIKILKIINMKRILFLAVAMGIGTYAYCQPAPPAPPVPLDGGLSLLAAGAVALGVRAYKKNTQGDI